MDIGLKVMGPAFVTFGLAIISAVVYVYFTVVLPYHADYMSTAGLIHMSWASFVILGIMYNYIMVIITPPGTPPMPAPEEEKLVEEKKNEPAPARGEGFSRYCKACKKPKPERSHHCHLCKQCVLRMDHHCPWVSNCVGFNNHPYFFLFLFWLTVGTCYLSIFSFSPFQDSTDFKGGAWKGGSRATIIFEFVVGVSIFLAVGAMMCWHFYLIATAQTTIEFYFNRKKRRQMKLKGEIYENPYDLGIRQNLKTFFGPAKHWLMWFLPTKKNPVGDGITYMTRTEFIKSYNFHYV
jgi:palmitoyltransferase